MDFGKKLKQYRKEHHMTQNMLAEKLHTSQPAISSYESGRRSPSTNFLARASVVLKWNEFEIADLVGGTFLIKEHILDYDGDFSYASDVTIDVEDAVELIRRYFTDEEKEFIAQLICFMIQQKGIEIIPREPGLSEE